MLTRRWGLSTQRIQLAKAMTFRFGNDETLETRTLAILPVGIGVNGVLRVYVAPGGATLLLSKEFLRDLGCHIDLGRGHLFFEKLGVRTVVTSEQSPHLLLHLTRFGPQRHKIPAEIQPRISSSTLPHLTPRDRTTYICGSLQHLITEHQKLKATRPPGQALGKWHGKGKYVSAVRDHQRQGRDHWNQQVGPEETGDRRGEASFQPDRTVEGRTELDLVQDEVDEAKRLLEEAHVEVQAAQNKVTEAAFRVGQAMEEVSQIRKLLEANSEPVDQ